MELFKDIKINSFDELKDIVKTENIVTSNVNIGRFGSDGVVGFVAEYNVPVKYAILKACIIEYDKRHHHNNWKVRLTRLVSGYAMTLIAE